MLYYYQGLFIPFARHVQAVRNLAGGYSFGDDFYQIWLTSRTGLRHRRDLYSPEMTREIQIGLYGRPLDSRRATDPKDLRMFPYPAFTGLLFWPASQIPFALVRAVVLGILVALTLATIWLWIRVLCWQLDWRWQAVAVLLAMCSYPVLEGLYALQVGLLVSFFLACSIFALQRGRLTLSGVLLALTTIKPQVTILAVLYLFVWTSQDWRNRWRWCAAFFSTLFLLAGAALVVWPHWIGSWINILVQYHGYTAPPVVSDVLATPLGPRLFGPVSRILVAGLVAIAVVLISRYRNASAGSAEFLLTLSVLLGITTIALLPGQAVYDHIILLPGIFLLASHKQPPVPTRMFRALLGTGSALLLWPWVSAFGLILLRPFLGPATSYPKAVLALPLRTSASFPFVVVALLALAMRATWRSGAASTFGQTFR